MLRKILALALLAAPGVAHAEWHKASSEHFVVYSEGSADDVRSFTTRLERFDKAMRVIFGTPDKPVSPLSRVSIYLVDTKSDIQKLFGGNIRGVAGFMMSRASGSIAFAPRSSSSQWSWDLRSNVILLHEYAHYFMYSSWPSAIFPMWFSEGFAEFNGTAEFKQSGNVVFGGVPMHRAFSWSQASTLPANRLLLLSPGKMADDERGVLYARGWALTHYLMFDKERSGQLAKYIIAINSGAPAAKAAEVFGNLGTLDLKISNYVNRKQLPLLTLSPAEVPVKDVKVEPMSPGLVAVMPARMRSVRGVDRKTAPEVAELARRLAAPFPNDPDAQNELAEAEFDAQNYAAAAAAADRALTADPKSIHALIYKGMAEVEIAKKEKVTDPARWTAIRASFRTANKLDTEYPEPLIQFYRSFEAAGQAPTKNAQSGLLYAYALAPYDLELRMLAAEVQLKTGDVTGARIALEPVAYSPHAGPAAAVAVKILEALTTKGPAEAVAVLENAKAAAAKEGDKKGDDKKGDDKKD